MVWNSGWNWKMVVLLTKMWYDYYNYYSTKVTGVAMKKHRRYLAIIIAVLSFLLCGCGTPVYELTAEEEALIVHYAAHYISKYNIYQKDGVVNVGVTDEKEESDNSEDATTQKPGDSEKPNTPSGSVDSIEEAIGLGSSLEITYKGSKIEESLKQGNAYFVDSGDGKVLFIMEFDVKNISEKTIELNHLKSDMTFKLKSGDIVSGHKETFINNDFSTYMGSIAAGETVEMILIFQVKDSDASQIVSPALQITVDGKTKTVEL